MLNLAHPFPACNAWLKTSGKRHFSARPLDRGVRQQFSHQGQMQDQSKPGAGTVDTFSCSRHRLRYARDKKRSSTRFRLDSERYRQRMLYHLKPKARELGFQLQPIIANAVSALITSRAYLCTS